MIANDLWLGTQDLCFKDKEKVNGAMLLDVSLGIIQTTAARPGMMTKDSFDMQSVRWRLENPLRVRDVSFATRMLVVEDESGVREGTSHMQFAWRRLKRRYWEVYFFGSPLS